MRKNCNFFYLEYKLYYQVINMTTAKKILAKHYQKYLADKIEIDCLTIEDPSEDIFNWKFKLRGPDDTPWGGLTYNGIIKFPQAYPFVPPQVIFTSKIFHPNIYPDGRVCISILHEGTDTYGYEDASERWTPVHTIISIFLSIITLFHNPNCESPANVDANIMYLRNKDEIARYIRS